MDKTWNNKAWFMVLPMLLLVAFSAVIPLMTVVNYSVQDTFGNNQFFWAGTAWFSDVLSSSRFHDALLRNLAFSAIILLIEVPLGLFIALAHLVWFSVVALLLTYDRFEQTIFKFKKLLEQVTGLFLLGLGIKLFLHNR